MSIKADKFREAISAASLSDARRIVLHIIRLSFRRKLYEYAQHHSIVDFDHVLVTQRHRDFRQTLTDTAQTKATDAQAATTNDELLIIFDTISHLL